VLSEQQLIGRVWRYPQPKTVHVYRLIGANSPDIFLNNISFSKGFIQDTFSNIGDKLSECDIRWDWCEGQRELTESDWQSKRCASAIRRRSTWRTIT
jgi:SNF2 family DNA or RNA helicase